MQNLVSRIAGINNEELANRGIGMGAAMGYTVRSIAYQFKGNDDNESSGGTNIISRVINKANNTESTSVNDVSYESYSKNAMEEPNSKPIVSENVAENNNNNSNTQNTSRESSNFNGIRRAYNVGKEFMNLGMYMAEGRNFKTNSQEQNTRRIYNRPNINNTRKEDIKEDENKTITVEVDDADE